MPKTRKQRNNKNNFRNKTYEKLLDRMVGGEKGEKGVLDAAIILSASNVKKERCKGVGGHEYDVDAARGCPDSDIYGGPGGKRKYVEDEKGEDRTPYDAEKGREIGTGERSAKESSKKDEEVKKYYPPGLIASSTKRNNHAKMGEIFDKDKGQFVQVGAAVAAAEEGSHSAAEAVRMAKKDKQGGKSNFDVAMNYIAKNVKSAGTEIGIKDTEIPNPPTKTGDQIAGKRRKRRTRKTRRNRRTKKRAIRRRKQTHRKRGSRRYRRR